MKQATKMTASKEQKIVLFILDLLSKYIVFYAIKRKRASSPELVFLKRPATFCIVEFLKVFPHPLPPSERESLVKVVGLIIQEMNLLSTLI
jgi:hypothetical protein